MSSITTFGSFTAARLGIYAAQMGLNVTGHNISNINTRGYSRQQLDQMALRTGGGERYYSKYDVKVGSGVLCTGVSQLRDPYLDIRYRNEQSSVGAMDAKLDGLEELSKILDEVGKGDGSGILDAQFSDLISQLELLSREPGQSDALLRAAANALAGYFNEYSGKLDTIAKNQDGAFRQDLSDVNSILKNLRTLNENIFNSELHGDSALALKDERNLLLDKLSGYMKITVEYKPTSVGVGSSVDQMIIRTAGSPQYTLVNGSFAAELSIRQVQKTDADGNPVFGDDGTPVMIDSPNYDLDLSELTSSTGGTWGEKTSISKSFATAADAQAALDALNAALAGGPNPKPMGNGQQIFTSYSLVNGTDADGNPTFGVVTEKRISTIEAKLGDTDLYGSLQATREILTEAGEFTTNAALAGDPGAATKRGIPFYRHSLDALAQKVASVLNGANVGYLRDADGVYLDKDSGNPLIDPLTGDPITTKTTMTPALEQQLKDHGKSMGGALFSNTSAGDDITGITAANISISKGWSNGDTHVVNSFVKITGSDGVGSAANDNYNHILLLMNSKQSYYATDLVPDAVGGTGTPLYTGDFQGMFGHTSSVLANDMRVTTDRLNNFAVSAIELDTNRSSVSGVDLNDEAANMMRYQKSYAAACRLLTTLDEALDKLINSTGVVGR